MNKENLYKITYISVIKFLIKIYFLEKSVRIDGIGKNWKICRWKYSQFSQGWGGDVYRIYREDDSIVV